MPRRDRIGPLLSYPSFVSLIAGEEPAEAVIYQKLVEVLHPSGLACPRCGVREGLKVHRRRREPLVDYLCTHCFRVFNAWTGTALQGTHRPPSHILYILHGIESGTSTSLIARELRCRRPTLITLRRRLQPLAGMVAGMIPQFKGTDLGPIGEKDGRMGDTRPSDRLRKLGESCH